MPRSTATATRRWPVTSAMTEAVPLPASTVLLLRDGTAGLEVFMVTRHQKSSFLGGALVFPCLGDG